MTVADIVGSTICCLVESPSGKAARALGDWAVPDQDSRTINQRCRLHAPLMERLVGFKAAVPGGASSK